MIIQLKHRDMGVDTLNNKNHFHSKEFEILHIINGQGTIMIKDKLFELKGNMIFLINNGDTHYTSPENPTKYIRNKIIFSNEILIRLAKELSCEKFIENLFSNGGSAISLSSDASQKIDNCFFELSKLSQTNSQNFNINFFINIFNILNIAFLNKGEKTINIDNKVANVISYINRNLQNKITLDSICKNTMVSKYCLYQNFKNVVGMTVFEYIEYSRISLAKDLLGRTDYSISDIAQKTGFESFAYFSKIFKKYENCTPTNYRKELSFKLR